MKRIGTRAKILVVVFLYVLVCSGVFLFRYVKNAEKWVSHPANGDVYQNGQLKRTGSVLSADGTVLFSGNGYNKDTELRKATLHAVGDAADSINTGVIKTQKAALISYNFIDGVYSPTGQGGTVSLTLDAKTQKAAYAALGSSNGTVGIYDYKTGRILCMVSKPSFDPQRVPDLDKDTYKGVFVNRLTGGVYVPGSVFKLITAAAAIENISDIGERTFTCNKGAEFGGQWVSCPNNHGKVDFDTALAKSCNAAFGEIAIELGRDTLDRYAGKAGVGKRFSIDGVQTSKGMIRVDKATKTELAWAGIGQYTTLVNPMQYMIFMGAIASGGAAPTPYYIESVKTSYGLPQQIRVPSPQSLLKKETADRLKGMMRNNTKTVYGDAQFSGWNLCAKTGTAEVEDGKPHAWFVGFLDNEETPLAFVVVVEHGGSGSGTALPVAKKALAAARELY